MSRGAPDPCSPHLVLDGTEIAWTFYWRVRFRYKAGICCRFCNGKLVRRHVVTDHLYKLIIGSGRWSRPHMFWYRRCTEDVAWDDAPVWEFTGHLEALEARWLLGWIARPPRRLRMVARTSKAPRLSKGRG
jgi:hypothetical protein